MTKEEYSLISHYMIQAFNFLQPKSDLNYLQAFEHINYVLAVFL